MTDIEKAADVAASVLPGPIGEALSQFLNDGVAIDDANANPHLMKLADAIIYADGIRGAVGLVYPSEGTEFFYGLAVQFALTGAAKTFAEATVLAETAVMYLLALAKNMPAEHAPRGYVNATARVFFLTERIATYNAELNEITEMLGGDVA